MTTRTTVNTFGNALRIIQTRSGAFDRITTEIQARRVNPQGGPGEHVQLEIAVTKHGEKRNTTQHASVSLSPEVAAFLVTALSKTITPDMTASHLSLTERDTLAREFYGLPVKAA
jgi:hypothetical protein